MHWIYNVQRILLPSVPRATVRTLKLKNLKT